LRELRDAARALAAVATQDARHLASSPMGRDAAMKVVNGHVRGAAQWAELQWAGALVAVPRSAVPAAGQLLAVFAGSIVDVLTAEYDLRACGAPGCVLFYARVHDRREWCSAACGNRARVARHSDRHRPHGKK